MAERGSPDAQYILIASKWPATLNKDIAPEYVSDGQSPDSYGQGLDRLGYLYVEPSVSSGTVGTQIATVTAPADPPASGLTWRFSQGRLWGWKTTSNTLYYGENNYDSDYLISGLGYVPCDFESGNITDVVPFGDGVAVFKESSLYIITNTDSPNARPVSHFVKQSAGLPTAGKWVVIDNLLIFANTHGIFQFDGQQVTELTMPIRNNLGSFSSDGITTLRADFEKRRVIGRGASDTKFIIEMGQEPKLYDYSTSGFRFTSRTLVGETAEPLLVDKIGLIYQYSTSNNFTVNLDVKINDDWKTENKFTIRPENGNGLAELNLTNVYACRKFALRITDMSSGLYVSSIMAHVKGGGVRGYSSK